MKKPVAFMSYAHRDDKSKRLTELREHLSEEVSVQTGEDFEIFQDRDAIFWGQNWEERIENSLDEVTFLIAIITPSFFRSPHCRNELEWFIYREKKLGRNDLILPIYYVDTPLVNDEAKRATDELAQVIATRQYVDWRNLRTEPLTSPQVVRKLSQLGSQIRDALDRVLEAEATVPTPTQGKVERHTTESARQKAQELGVDLSQVEGSGAGGRIIVKDVVSAAPQKRLAREPPPVIALVTGADAADRIQRLRSLAFMTYARRDDRRGELTELRKKLQAEVEEAFGHEFIIFQDNESIRVGQNWKRQIEESLDEAIFFIPIITSSFFSSEYCRLELKRFLEREKRLSRDDLIFPIYYRSSPQLDDEEKRENDEMAKAIHAHQYADWRELRYEPLESAQVRRAVADFASNICEVLQKLDGELELEPTSKRLSAPLDVERTVRSETKATASEHQKQSAKGKAGAVASGEQQAPTERPTTKHPDALSPETIFVSYSRKDWDEFVQPLVTDLRERGFKVWIDQRFILGGDNWYRVIQQALETCERMVLCVSPNSLESPYVQREYRYFMAKEKWLLPLMCREVSLPWDFEGIQYLPYQDRDALVESLREW